MKQLDLSFPTTAENLAADEVLLDWLDKKEESPTFPDGSEVLRLWENPKLAVVVGRSSRRNDEVDLDWCQRNGVPVYRRASGGTSVLIGPGCLMYSVFLQYHRRPELKQIDQAHLFVMDKLVTSLKLLGLDPRFQGTCDLTIENKKFSGNALRCKRNVLLYHGTLLYDFPLRKLAQSLGTPPRQPEYREGRTHLDFVTNLNVSASSLRSALWQSWSAETPLLDWPHAEVRRLADARYEQDAWNGAR